MWSRGCRTVVPLSPTGDGWQAGCYWQLHSSMVAAPAIAILVESARTLGSGLLECRMRRGLRMRLLHQRHDFDVGECGCERCCCCVRSAPQVRPVGLGGQLSSALS